MRKPGSSTGTPRRARRRVVATFVIVAPLALAFDAGMRAPAPETAIGAEPWSDPVAGMASVDPPVAAVAEPGIAGAATPGETAAVSAPAPVPLTDEVRWFNGRPVHPVRTMRMTVTAYSPDERSCGRFADGTTASGYSVWTNGMKLVAADTRLLPFGTLLSVPGYDGEAVVPVLDRGGRIKGHRLDVLYPTHRRALRWGVRELDVTIWEYADGKPSDFRPRW